MDLLLPALGLLFWTLFSLVAIVLIIIAIVNLAKNQTLNSNSKILWVLLIIAFPLIGAIVYLTNRKTK